MKKVIYISESKLPILKESENEVTFYSFFTNIKDFIQELLVDPINAKPNDFLKSHGFNKSGLIKKLMDRDIINRKENIKEVPNGMVEDGKQESMYSVQYKVPKKNFERKIHRLYSRLFEANVFNNQESMIEDILNMDNDNAYKDRGGLDKVVTEDGEGSMAFGGATNANISAAAMYDVPMGGVQRKKFYGDTLKRNKDEENNSISMNHKK